MLSGQSETIFDAAKAQYPLGKKSINNTESHSMKLFGYVVEQPINLIKGIGVSVGAVICCFFGQKPLCIAIGGTAGLLAFTYIESSINKDEPEQQKMEWQNKVSIE